MLESNPPYRYAGSGKELSNFVFHIKLRNDPYPLTLLF